MTTPTEHRLQTPHTDAPASPAEPRCAVCNSDAELSYDAFVPACSGTESSGPAPSVVSYTCRRCGSHYTHQAPDDWAPPGWEWYD